MRKWLSSLSEPITKGDLWTLVRVSLPIMFFLFCETAALFIERIFLSYHSQEGPAVSLHATYLAMTFQGACVAVISTGQLFVGLYQGSGELKKIGPCIWQLIWFSFLSMLVTLPLGILLASWYFKGTAIAHAGVAYFNILSMGNFLFPLCASLSFFYLGRGKTFYVTALMLGSYLLHVLLSRCLILGVDGVIPAFGVIGGVLAKCVSLGVVCMILMRSFLSKTNQEIFNTHAWKFTYAELWSYVRPGLAGAFAYVSIKAWWMSVPYFMLRQGGLSSDILTIGGTVISFLLFCAVGSYKTMLIIASNLLGVKNYAEVWRLCHSFLIYMAILGYLLAFPLIVVPDVLAYFFDPQYQTLFNEVFPTMSLSVYGCLMTTVIQMALYALIVAAKDYKLQFYCYPIFGLVSFIGIYFLIYQGRWAPDKLWIITGLENIIFASIFFLRVRRQHKPRHITAEEW